MFRRISRGAIYRAPTVWPVPVLLLVWLLSGAGCQVLGVEVPDTQHPTPNTRRPTPNTHLDDLQYIDMMVPHHQLAIDMARIALEHARHGELVGLSRDIIQAQQDEIERMAIWREEICRMRNVECGMRNMTPSPDSQEMLGMDVDLEGLAASSDFDRAFMEAMISHHQGAIDMSRAALPHLQRAELRDLARDIITTQQVEIDRMRAWLREW
jgi:uncharacterized protein (DUF305 family)